MNIELEYQDFRKIVLEIDLLNDKYVLSEYYYLNNNTYNTFKTDIKNIRFNDYYKINVLKEIRDYLENSCIFIKNMI